MQSCDDRQNNRVTSVPSPLYTAHRFSKMWVQNVDKTQLRNSKQRRQFPVPPPCSLSLFPLCPLLVAHPWRRSGRPPACRSSAACPSRRPLASPRGVRATGTPAGSERKSCPATPPGSRGGGRATRSGSVSSRLSACPLWKHVSPQVSPSTQHIHHTVCMCTKVSRDHCTLIYHNSIPLSSRYFIAFSYVAI